MHFSCSAIIIFYKKSDKKWQVSGVGGMSKYIDISFDYDDDDDGGNDDSLCMFINDPNMQDFLGT